MSKHVYIVAEISANHNQSYEQAEKLVHAAKRVGADAVKLQTYMPDTLTIKCDKPEFKIKGNTPWDDEYLYDLYNKTYMPWEWQPKLKKIADDIGIDLFSTAYDKTSVDFLEEMQVPMYKIASFELVDLALIEYVAGKKKPIIMSTGMADLSEIKEAVVAAKNAGARDITLLKCTSAYPAPYNEMNLLGIPAMVELFKLPVGLSDHTLGIVAPIVAVALGATVIEKHITLSHDVDTPDRVFSLEPQEFRDMVEAVRVAEATLGDRFIGVTETESNIKAFRRSLFAVKDIKSGEKFTNENVGVIRQGHGLMPQYLNWILRKKAKRDIGRGTPIKWELVEFGGGVAQSGERLVCNQKAEGSTPSTST